MFVAEKAYENQTNKTIKPTTEVGTNCPSGITDKTYKYGWSLDTAWNKQPYVDISMKIIKKFKCQKIGKTLNVIFKTKKL